MPETRPGIKFNEEGVCLACLAYEKRQQTDWTARQKELMALCESHRSDGSSYDVLLPVSGGKDSHVLVATMMDMGMHPLLFSVTDPFTKTEAGKHNLANLIDHFGCDHVAFTLNTDLHRKLMRYHFEKELSPLKIVEMLIYLTPTMYASMHNIPLVFYGEDSSYLYGTSQDETPDAMPTIRAMYDVLRTEFWGKITERQDDPDYSFLCEAGEALRRHLRHFNPDGTSVRWMSYYRKWDDEDNLAIARQHGFKDLKGEWDREGWIEHYTQIDSLAYLVHIWLKFPKYGFQRISDVASRWVRKGKISRDFALGLVDRYDHELDTRAAKDFVSFCGYEPAEFTGIIYDHPFNTYMKGIGYA
jgi:N-acetyl sugar amidotransferase